MDLATGRPRLYCSPAECGRLTPTDPQAFHGGDIQGVIDEKVPLRVYTEEDDERTKALLERCEYLLETAEDVNESLSDSIDFYLNNTSYQMNRVMKVIAVLTALTIIPTVVGGLLGMNLVGAPWPISIAQTVTVVALVMLSTAWIYYRIGWLR